MTNRPYFRHGIDEIEMLVERRTVPTDALLAELEHRTTPRARALLAKLKAGTATAPKIDARPVPVAVDRVKGKAKGKQPAKPVARPGASVAPAASIGKHPGAAPDRWEDLTDAQRAWWSGIMPWLFDGRVPLHSPAEYLEWHKRGAKLSGRGPEKRSKIPAGVPFVEVPVGILPFGPTETEKQWMERMRQLALKRKDEMDKAARAALPMAA